MVILMSKTLEFGAVVREPDIRYAKDMGEVILDREWLEENPDAELYYMYRDLWRENDEQKIKEEGLRYDITVIPPRVIGKEYVKTKGHYHPVAEGEKTYPEIYEVLEGKAHYLLQKKSGEGVIDDVLIVKAQAGEKAIIPPNYGHITINPSNESLKMANWVDRRFDSIYEDILDLEGGAYFELSDGEFVKNEKYEEVPDLRFVEPSEVPELGIESGADMYNLIDDPSNLNFLKKPQEYESIFSEVI